MSALLKYVLIQNDRRKVPCTIICAVYKLFNKILNTIKYYM